MRLPACPVLAAPPAASEYRPRQESRRRCGGIDEQGDLDLPEPLVVEESTRGRYKDGGVNELQPAAVLGHDVMYY